MTRKTVLQDDVKMLQYNYDALRPMSSLEYLFLGYCDLPIPRNLGIAQIARFQRVQDSFIEIVKIHRSILNRRGGDVGRAIRPDSSAIRLEDALRLTPSPGIYEYHFTCETFILDMRRYIDSLIQLIQIEQYHRSNDRTGDKPVFVTVDPDGVGRLLANKQKFPVLTRLLFGEPHCEKCEEFCSLINSLSNAVKHHAYYSDVYNMIGETCPTIVGYEMRNKRAEIGIYHNHNAYHVMMGFQDFVTHSARQVKEHFYPVGKGS